ncbi:excalibur calcium-binding domain-containing protein [Thermomonas sp. HDW16]|nr:excalibur calcium-binding domain-containing protein [Thermomonas sp. HDW16]
MFAYDKYKSHKSDQAEILAAAPVAVQPQQAAPSSDDRSWIKPRAVEPTVSGSQFKCDGRTHCSQMRSCAEAEFFLKNCPNTQMDGNNDGEPCEQQWCK